MHQAKLTDPVCGMTVDSNSRYRHRHDKTDYFFCSQHCQQQFAAEPDKYLHTEHTPAEASGYCADGTCDIDAVLYTCPMHPEVRQHGPGSCPKCGMALEPASVTSEENNTELIDMTRRFRASGWF